MENKEQKFGIESLKASVLADTKAGQDCFNENGCDHEFTRMVPQDNPKLIKMGFTQSCLHVCKCTHKYCDKFKWVIERAKYYAEKKDKTYEEVIEIWEQNRGHNWYMNYYQEGFQPLDGFGVHFGPLIQIKDRIEEIKKELEGWDTILSLTNEGNPIKSQVAEKVAALQQELTKSENRLALYELGAL